NQFNGTGSGSFGTAPGSTSSGFTIHFEMGDFGDSSSGDNTSADFVSFTVTDSHGSIVWSGRGNLTSGNQEINQNAVVAGSCEPSSSLSVMVQGSNVTSYVPKGNWTGGATGISAVNVEGSAITPTQISTPDIVNSAGSNPTTGTTVATSNNTDV